MHRMDCRESRAVEIAAKMVRGRCEMKTTVYVTRHGETEWNVAEADARTRKIQH